MKICLISTECYPFFYGGIGTAFYFLGKKLSSKGHDVVLLTKKPFEWKEEIHEQYFKDNFNARWVEYEEGKFSPHAKLDYSFQMAGYFEEFHSTYQADLVIYPEYDGEAFFLLKAKNEGKYSDVAFVVHYSGPLFSLFAAEGHISSLYEKIIFEAEKYCIMASTFAIAPSVFIYDMLSRQLGLGNRPHFILPNPVNPDLFAPSPPLITGKASDEKIILFIGRLQKTKGVDLLIKAFQSIVENEKEGNIRLQLIGKDVYWEEYQMNFSDYWKNCLPEAVLAKVDFAGHIQQNEIAGYLKKAWVAVFPSRFEVFGNVALEAINLGVPILVNKSTGLSEVAGPHYNFFWQGGENPATLAEQLSLILTDIDLRNKLAVSSYERARELQEQFPSALDSLLEKIKRYYEGNKPVRPFPEERMFILLNQYAAQCLQEKNAEIRGVYEIKNRELDKAWDHHEVKDRELKEAWDEIERKDGELKKAWNEIEIKDGELKKAWSEIEGKGGELKKAWSEIEGKGGELKKAWSEIEGNDGELKKAWSEIEGKDGELKKAWSEIERKGADLETAWGEVRAKSQELEKVWEETEKKNLELGKAWTIIEEKDRIISQIFQQQRDAEVQVQDLEQRLDSLKGQLHIILMSNSYKLSQRLKKSRLFGRTIRLFTKK